jgi:hypothetical protein
MRIAIAIFALVCPAEPSLAQANQEQGHGASIARVKANNQLVIAETETGGPREAGVDLSIDVDPGATRLGYGSSRSARFPNAGEARRSCLAARGTFRDTAGRLECRNPRIALRNADGDIVVTGTRIPQPNLN